MPEIAFAASIGVRTNTCPLFLNGEWKVLRDQAVGSFHLRKNTCPLESGRGNRGTMDTQLALELPSAPAEGSIPINARCQVRQQGEHRVVVVAGLPMHHYVLGDAVAEAYAMVFLVDSGFAQQREVARAFGCAERTVRRHQQRYAEGGMAALAVRSGWRPGRRRLPPKRLRVIERCKAEGMSNRAIASRYAGAASVAVAEGHGGSVTLIQRFGSALNLNVHLHMLFLDGVYVQVKSDCFDMHCDNA